MIPKRDYDEKIIAVLGRLELPASWQEVFWTLIYITMIRLDGNRYRTAKALGISLRTLRSKMLQMEGSGYHVPPSGFIPGRPAKPKEE
jgi:DNA-binding NtrC family response regulator